MAFTARTVSLARAAITAVGKAIDVVVRALTGAWVKAWDALAEPFTDAVENLAADPAVADTGQWPGRRTIETDPALQQALADAATVMQALTDLTVSEVTSVMNAAVTQATTDQAEIITSQLPPDGGTPSPPSGGFHQRAIDLIRARVQQRIISLTRPLAADADAAMRQELVRGVRTGTNPRETSRRMVDRVEGAFNGGLTRALVIARTETLDAYRQAAAATQEAASDVVTGWVWLAHLGDDRTCPACWVMHGTEHPLTEPGPLGHPQCRCSRTPKTATWADLGFDMEEPPDAIPDAETAFKALPHDRQVKIMGAARLALLDSGAITWNDLARRRQNPGWRDSYMPTPVRDLAS